MLYKIIESYLMFLKIKLIRSSYQKLYALYWIVQPALIILVGHIIDLGKGRNLVCNLVANVGIGIKITVQGNGLIKW